MSTRGNAGEPARWSPIPSPDEARDWLKEWGEMPDITLEIHPTMAPGSAERHLKMLKMLFEPSRGAILPPHG